MTEQPHADEGRKAASDERHLDEALRLAGVHIQADFSGYKRSMLWRRVRRRLSLAGLPSMADYVERLIDDEAELERLAHDLLISVTHFFRDDGLFKKVRDALAPKLFEQVEASSPLKVWVPGCASGEEAYSLAIMLEEAMLVSGRSVPLQIFATDIDEQALRIARAAKYPDKIRDHVSARILERYFERVASHFRINRAIRDHVVFARQNVLTDPPYSNLNLISCRNLLIYLDQKTQNQALGIFHFGLRKDGFLLLGSSETVGENRDLFHPLDTVNRIYVRATSSRRPAGFIRLGSAGQNTSSRNNSHEPTPTTRMSSSTDLDATLRQLMLSQYVTPCAVINSEMDVLCTYGDVSRFLSLPTGISRLNLMSMISDSSTRNKLRVQIQNASRTKARATVDPRPAKEAAGASSPYRMDVVPLTAPPSVEGLFLVLFETVTASAGKVVLPQGGDDSLEEQLAAELESVHEELGATIKALESSNEDLRSSNEEITSMNEELQSTNEELETSKEEMQTLNEELATVNQELNAKLAELEAANEDFANLFTLIDVAVVFVDHEARIKRFTPAATQLINLRPTDIGRPLKDIALNFRDPDLFEALPTVISRESTHRAQIESSEGIKYLRTILPHRSLDESVHGALIHFEDISELEHAENAARLSGRQVQLLTDSLPALIVYLDQHKHIRFANSTAAAWLGDQMPRLIGQSFPDVLSRIAGRDISAHCDQALEGDAVNLEDTLRGREGGKRHVQITLTPELSKTTSLPIGIHVIAFDTTARRQAETLRAENAARSARLEKEVSLVEMASSLAHQLNQPLTALGGYAGTINNLAQRKEDATMQLMSEKILNHVRQAGEVVNNLRTFLSDRNPVFEYIEIDSVIHKVLGLTEAARENQDVKTTTRLQSGLPAIQGNAVLLEQLLLNLISNAVEAMRNADHRVLEIGTQADDNGLLLWVRDSGQGIAENRVPKAFEAFTTTKPASLGLGLAICRSVMEDHEGRISLQSSASHGTTVSCYFPLPSRATNTSNDP